MRRSCADTVGSKYLRSAVGTSNPEKLALKLNLDADDATSTENWKQLFNCAGLGKTRLIGHACKFGKPNPPRLH